jgi:cyclopropane-fatty-acyl-phospholipid synthase
MTMTATTATAPEEAQVTPEAQETLDLLDELFRGFGATHFAVRLWDGTWWGRQPEQAATVLVLRRPGSLRHFLTEATEVHAAECYLHDVIDIEGDMEGIMPVAEWLLGQPAGAVERLRLGRKLRKLPRLDPPPQGDGRRGPARLSGVLHSIARDREAVTYHYDVSNRFYGLWLDRSMSYSCALFARPDEHLDTAQERKLEYVCRKLRLRPGDRLLDIGCGWGALIVYAAQRYGVEAVGITLSVPQAEFANEAIAAAGLADRCHAEVCDYRQTQGDGCFDKLVSIGMVEHVGAAQLQAYFAHAFRLLRPGGTFLSHGIGDLPGRPPKSRHGFIDAYIFPDGERPPIPQTLAAAEACGFEPRDVESLREHYAMTLRHWVMRLEAQRDAAIAEAGEAVYRTWRLYMAGCAHWFTSGHISVYQSLLVKPDQGRSGLPLLRTDWYDPPLQLPPPEVARAAPSAG